MAPFTNAALTNFFNKMNKKLNVCNADCQRKRKLEKLKTDFFNAQNRVQNSKPEFDNAEKHYLSEKYGDTYYNNVLENRAKMEAWKHVFEWNKYINPIIVDLETKANYSESQEVYRKNINYVKDSYEKELRKLKKEVDDTVSKSRVNHRLGEYYSNSSESINNVIYYLKIFYWILVGISIFLIGFKKKYKQPIYWPYFIFIISFPWILNYSFLGIMKIFRHIYIDNIYLISIILLSLCLFIFNKVASLPFPDMSVPE